MTMNFPSPFRSACLGAGLVFSVLTGCYNVEFDEQMPDVYYCQTNDECLDGQACKQFRCVDDSGPKLTLDIPEALTPYLSGTQDLTVTFAVDEFTLSDSTERVEGEGMVAVYMDGEQVAVTAIEGAQLSFDQPLAPGGHHLAIQAVYGDGTPYGNPSAHDFTAIFVQDENTNKPQVAVLEPSDGHVHILGEDLVVEVASRNFPFVSTSSLCSWEANCDPFAVGAMCLPDPDTCMNEVPINQGHVHIYLLPDYPTCLLTDNPLESCNGGYALAMVLNQGGVTGDEDSLVGKVPAAEFPTPGTYTMRAALQYGGHPPFPNPQFVIFDTITIEVVER